MGSRESTSLGIHKHSWLSTNENDSMWNSMISFDDFTTANFVSNSFTQKWACMEFGISLIERQIQYNKESKPIS